MNATPPNDAEWRIVLDAGDAESLAALAHDRVWNSFALADLSPPMRAFTQIAVASSRTSDAVASCLVVRHPAFVVLSPAGVMHGVKALLDRIDLPPTALIQTLEAHRPAVERYYHAVARWHAMLRMATDAAHFVLAQGLPPMPMARLVMEDLPALLALYAHYPGAHFRPELLADGAFYGIREGELLVAAGGTHIVDVVHGIAVLGSIFTLPAWRGRGCASAVTSALTADLLSRRCRDVVLNVLVENVTAIRVYRGLGFEAKKRYWSAEANLIP